MSKRKRETALLESRKLPRLHQTCRHSPDHCRQPLLQTYYSKVCSLSEFLLSRLPSSSRLRRRRIITFGVDYPEHARFLDDTLVGILQEPSVNVLQTRKQDLVTFTQTQKAHLGHSGKPSRCDIEEVIGFVIWQLFQKESHSRRPDHLLCHGYQRCDTIRAEDGHLQHLALPGIVRQTHNANVDLLSTSPWTTVLNLLGEGGDLTVASLLLDCGVFQHLHSGEGNLYQLSGKPIFRLLRTGLRSRVENHAVGAQNKQGKNKTASASDTSSITIVRNRMFYARPSINAHGNVALGLKHIHVFNRYDRLADSSHDLQVMRYVFPRQFGLHNAFTCKVDRSETVQPRKDYTIREHETEELVSGGRGRAPPRLRTTVMALIRSIRRNHRRCSYSQLLRHYCPVLPVAQRFGETQFRSVDTSIDQSANLVTQLSASRVENLKPIGAETSMTLDNSYLPYIVPALRVSTFCQNVLRHLLPRDVFGRGDSGGSNWLTFLSNVDSFINMRRYETISLHELSQDMKLKCIEWLRPPGLDRKNNLSASDKAKRLELLLEFLYFLFDSVVIPLIRSNFYVTESGVHRNRLLYFRHDVWRRLSEPSLTCLRVGTFKPLNPRQLRYAFESNRLGYSQIRLLPKESGARPITNLKRRPVKLINGKRILGQSINTQLKPVFGILNLEYQRNPHRLASALFSLSDIQGKLKSFQANLDRSPSSQFYFVKVDIQSCFDTIPQQELLALIDTILLEKEYRTSSHVEVKQLAGSGDPSNAQIVTKFKPDAQVLGSGATFSVDIATRHAEHRRKTVFVGNEQERTWRLQQIQRLLREHIEQNIVKIGRRHFRQVDGIPQGSVLSSLLCNFFYADFEQNHLAFLDPNSSLLLRLVDDFLLITTDKEQAKSFARVMSQGHPGYGITTNADKSLANFELTVSGRQIPRLHGTLWFPYCGLGIDMRTLDLSKDRRPKDKYLENTLTVVSHGKQGKMFQRKIVSALRIQLQAMLLDDKLNHRLQIICTLFESFVETTMKMHRYRNSLPRGRRPGTSLMMAVCRQLMSLANRVMHRERHADHTIVTESQIRWIASTAMAKVLFRKQSEYTHVLEWLLKLQASTQNSMGMDEKVLDGIARTALARFQDYVY